METNNVTHSNPSAATPIPFSASDALLWNALPDLKLNIAQTADLCGISVRQLGYWTKQGYIKAVGKGARRLYDLEALRRILGIRHAMQDGTSLRQALRTIPTVTTAEVMASLDRNGHLGQSIKPVPDLALPTHVADIIATHLLAFFQDNRYARDNATGLAAKLGRTEDDVRSVAEMLCGAGSLSKTYAQGDTIFLYSEAKF